MWCLQAQFRQSLEEQMTTSASRMSHLKRVGYCLSIALVVTAFASLFYREGGELLAVPGLIVSGFLFAFGTSGDDFGPVIPWQFPSVFFYAIVFYGISWAYTGLRQERE